MPAFSFLHVLVVAVEVDSHRATRCTTLTKLPVAFCGGRIANCAPVPGLSEPMVPLKT